MWSEGCAILTALCTHSEGSAFRPQYQITNLLLKLQLPKQKFSHFSVQPLQEWIFFSLKCPQLTPGGWKLRCYCLKLDVMDLAFKSYDWISTVPDQSGISLLYIILEIHHSGREPSIYTKLFGLCLSSFIFLWRLKPLLWNTDSSHRN